MCLVLPLKHILWKGKPAIDWVTENVTVLNLATQALWLLKTANMKCALQLAKQARNISIKITWEILSNRKSPLAHGGGNGGQLCSQNEVPADSCPQLKQTSFLVYFP